MTEKVKEFIRKQKVERKAYTLMTVNIGFADGKVYHIIKHDGIMFLLN
jgi:hypothetical protein